jgi:hypothetical protein
MKPKHNRLPAPPGKTISPKPLPTQPQNANAAARDSLPRISPVIHPKPLAAILNPALRDAWNQAAAAPEFKPIPADEYTCRVTETTVEESRTNQTPCVKIAFEVSEGEFRGRKLWHRVWLTTSAMSITKRELGKLGISEFDEVGRPLRHELVCRVRVAIRRGDDQREFNHVTRFAVVRTEPLAADPFAPAERR